jgi:hypothetical protein
MLLKRGQSSSSYLPHFEFHEIIPLTSTLILDEPWASMDVGGGIHHKYFEP